MTNGKPSALGRAKASIAAPIKRQLGGLNGEVIDVIHAIKNELMQRFDSTDDKIHNVSVATGDRLSLQTSRIASLEAEVKALRAEVAAAKNAAASQVKPKTNQ